MFQMQPIVSILDLYSHFTSCFSSLFLIPIHCRSSPSKSPDVSCSNCKAPISQYKYQFACLLQDVEGIQLPVIFHDTDAVSPDQRCCMFARLKAQYLNRPIGTLSFQLGTIKVRIEIIFFHASCLLTIHLYIACIPTRIQDQISKCKYKPCVQLARVAMSGLISASSLTRLISTAKKIDDFEYSTPS